MNKDNKKWAINNIKYLARFFVKIFFLIHLFFLIQFYMIRPLLFIIHFFFIAGLYDGSVVLIGRLSRNLFWSEQDSIAAQQIKRDWKKERTGPNVAGPHCHPEKRCSEV